MSNCPFCGETRTFQHAIAIAGQPSRLLRCRRCEACSPEATVPEDCLLGIYNDSYFSLAEWEIAKSRLLASDYMDKAAQAGLLGTSGAHLEIGGSYGFFADKLHQASGAAPDVLELSRGCQNYMREHFPGLILRGATLADLPVAPHYTRVFGFHLLEHLQDITGFYRELARRMTPGGLAFFLTPNASSQGFIRHGSEWGWSCPDQHCQFLSPFIPAAYYESVGFELVSATTVRPAAIHTPSSALVHLNRLHSRLAPSRAQAVSPRTLPAKALGRVVDGLRRLLLQNDPNAHLLPLERGWHRFRSTQRYDELTLVLRRTV